MDKGSRFDGLNNLLVGRWWVGVCGGGGGGTGYMSTWHHHQYTEGEFLQQMMETPNMLNTSY